MGCKFSQPIVYACVAHDKANRMLGKPDFAARNIDRIAKCISWKSKLYISGKVCSPEASEIELENTDNQVSSDLISCLLIRWREKIFNLRSNWIHERRHLKLVIQLQRKWWHKKEPKNVSSIDRVNGPRDIFNVYSLTIRWSNVWLIIQ